MPSRRPDEMSMLMVLAAVRRLYTASGDAEDAILYGLPHDAIRHRGVPLDEQPSAARAEAAEMKVPFRPRTSWVRGWRRKGELWSGLN